MGAIKPTLCMRGAGDLFLAVTGEISIPQSSHVRPRAKWSEILDRDSLVQHGTLPVGDNNPQDNVLQWQGGGYKAAVLNI